MINAIEWGELVITLGFAAWLLLGVVNHLADVQGTLAFIASFTKLAPLDQEPAIPSPLKSRKIESRVLHRLALIVIILAQAVLGILFAAAAWLILRGAGELARLFATYAFAGLIALWFGFLIAGSWFGYWIRQGDLQRTHLLLLAVSMLGFIIMAR